MVGDRNDSATRLLEDNVLRLFEIDFGKLWRIPAQRRILEVGMSIEGETQMVARCIPRCNTQGAVGLHVGAT